MPAQHEVVDVDQTVSRRTPESPTNVCRRRKPHRLSFRSLALAPSLGAVAAPSPLAARATARRRSLLPVDVLGVEAAYGRFV